jgi:hypothetical protein
MVEGIGHPLVLMYLIVVVTGYGLILVVGHALNLVLNKVSETSVYSFGNCGLEA